MHKVLIADDESSVRNGLTNYFDWAKYDMEIVGDAADGLEALDKVKRLKPDVVITDVKMPRMGGIELAEHINKLSHKIKIIFISGHNDVAFLKSALQMDAIDYIFKPVNFTELHRVIDRVSHMISAEKQHQDIINAMDLKLTQSMPLLKEKFFMSLIKNDEHTIKNMEEKLSFLEIDLPAQREYNVVIISVDNKDLMFENVSEREKNLTVFAILNVCQELIERYFKGYAFENSEGEYVCILSSDQAFDTETHILELAGCVRESLLTHLDISITVGIGEKVSGIENISKSYASASEAVRQRFFLGKNNIIKIDSLQTISGTPPKFDFGQGEKLALVIKSGVEERVYETLDAIFEEISANHKYSIKYCQTVCFQIFLHTTRLMMELNIWSDEVINSEKEFWELVFKAETVKDLKELIKEHLHLVLAVVNQYREKQSGAVIEKIKEIIERRYHENLTIHKIAEEVFLTATYICLLFKQETGETINDYLTKVRVEKSIRMLKDPKKKLYNISSSVGYTEPSYFTKIFKKHTGLTPREYRNKVISYIEEE